jgi:hypothetical protein
MRSFIKVKRYRGLLNNLDAAISFCKDGSIIAHPKSNQIFNLQEEKLISKGYLFKRRILQ